MKLQREEKWMIGLAGAQIIFVVLWLLAIAAFWVGAIYVAWHFISKLW